MSVAFQDQVLDLPSVRSFIAAISEDLMNGISTVALLPLGIDADKLWHNILNNLRRRSYAAEEVVVSDLRAPDGLASALAERLGVLWATPTTSRTIGNLLRCDGLPEVVQLRGINDLVAAERPPWFRLIAQWAQASQNTAGGAQLPTALCVLLPAHSILPHEIATDVRLAIHWWWGFPSALELRLLCRATPRHHPGTPRSRWLEHVIPAISGSDLQLMQWVRGCDDLGPNNLLPFLRDLAEQQGWTQDQLREWGADGVRSGGNGMQGQSASPPKFTWQLWARGSAGSTPEYGVELSAAALAALHRDKEVWHRLWRGEAELLLPLLDQARLVLCDHLTDRYGQEWPVKWSLPDRPEDEAAVRNNPLACQWGYLEWLVKNCAPLREEQRWLTLIRNATQVRNAIAHYEPVGYGRFEFVVREFDRFKEHIGY